MKTINIKLHSIVLLVGPSGSGKTFFCQNSLIPQLKKYETVLTNKQLNVQYLSTDNIRKELLGKEHNKLDDEMLYVSGQAFNLLFSKLKALTSYPVNSDIVIIDSTGLDKKFREDIVEVAKTNNYNLHTIVFDFKQRDDYFTFVEENELNRKLINKHIFRLRHETLREINKKFGIVTKITSKNFNDYEIILEDIELYSSCFLSQNNENVIISDVHGCFDEFIELIKKLNFEIDENNYIDSQASSNINRHIVLVGDLIDKGPKTKQVIDFVYLNQNMISIVKGNHENYVYKTLKGEIKERNKELEETYLTSIKELENDKITREKFFTLVEKSKPFLSHKHFIVTHAPCLNNYLGKIDSTSAKKQRSIVYPKQENFPTLEEYKKKVENCLSFLRTESSFNLPFHIFGHIISANIARIKNKIILDTGCYCGGKLSGVIINKDRKPFYQSVNSLQPKTKEQLISLFDQSTKELLTLNDIEPKEKGRILWMIENKINFISGTMSPVDKDEVKNDIESLEAGLNYYKDKGIEKVTLQPKYMGSRCQVYLNLEDISKSYAVSRGGYLIKQLDLTKVYENLYDHIFKNDLNLLHIFTNAKLVIIDGELMPWFALGKELIQQQYEVVKEGVESEIKFLKETGFESQILKLSTKYNNTDFETTGMTITKEEGKKKFGETNYNTFKNFRKFLSEYQYLEIQQDGFNIFSKQLQLYGKEGELHFNPFSILKFIYKDDSEYIPFDLTNDLVFSILNENKQEIIDLTKENSLEIATKFYNEITTEKQMEGVVVKPINIYTKGVAPYLKYRNKEYLTLIYGFDYLGKDKYSKLVSRKGIRNKLNLSISEFETGKRMLETPYKDITKENTRYISLCIQMVHELEKERELDPRL